MPAASSSPAMVKTGTKVIHQLKPKNEDSAAIARFAPFFEARLLIALALKVFSGYSPRITKGRRDHEYISWQSHPIAMRAKRRIRMMNRADKAWLAIGMDAWLLGAEASMVMALRGMKLAKGGAAAWKETQRMVAEKSEAHLALTIALASGQLGLNPETIAKGTITHYRKHVRANRRRLTGG